MFGNKKIMKSMLIYSKIITIYIYSIEKFMCKTINLIEFSENEIEKIFKKIFYRKIEHINFI